MRTILIAIAVATALSGCVSSTAQFALESAGGSCQYLTDNGQPVARRSTSLNDEFVYGIGNCPKVVPGTAIRIAKVDRIEVDGRVVRLYRQSTKGPVKIVLRRSEGKRMGRGNLYQASQTIS